MIEGIGEREENETLNYRRLKGLGHV